MNNKQYYIGFTKQELKVISDTINCTTPLFINPMSKKDQIIYEHINSIFDKLISNSIVSDHHISKKMDLLLTRADINYDLLNSCNKAIKKAKKLFKIQKNNKETNGKNNN